MGIKFILSEPVLMSFQIRYLNDLKECASVLFFGSVLINQVFVSFKTCFHCYEWLVVGAGTLANELAMKVSTLLVCPSKSYCAGLSPVFYARSL